MATKKKAAPKKAAKKAAPKKKGAGNSSSGQYKGKVFAKGVPPRPKNSGS